jgi:hypothetical protein
MSTVAVFKMSCCGREVVHGRHEGGDHKPTAGRCYYECPLSKDPRGKPDRPTLTFVRYVNAELLTPELRATAGKWLRWPEVA